MSLHCSQLGSLGGKRECGEEMKDEFVFIPPIPTRRHFADSASERSEPDSATVYHLISLSLSVILDISLILLRNFYWFSCSSIYQAL